jgi:hypothetical protein
MYAHRKEKMKKLLLRALPLVLVLLFPLLSIAGVSVQINVSVPPPISFRGQPQLIVLPGTYIYAAPDVDADIFFYNGWWWRSWEGRWYRSRDYRSGWSYSRSTPSFSRQIPSNWRKDYRERRWQGQQWNIKKIPHQQVQKDWRSWEKNKHWEKQQTWGVRGLRAGTQSQHPSGKEVQTQRSRTHQKEGKDERSDQHKKGPKDERSNQN